MSQDEFTKLFSYMQKEFAEIKSELATKASADVMNNRFDQVIGALDDLTTEQAAIVSQLDRHDGWIRQLSDHVDLKLATDGQ